MKKLHKVLVKDHPDRRWRIYATFLFSNDAHSYAEELRKRFINWTIKVKEV